MPNLSAVQKKFILHWGEMGARWGINRTVAQVHALLYLSATPLDAEDIAKTLGVARSNVSTSLRELQGWGIVRVTHLLGDRRDHFMSLTDVWEMFRIILQERKRREIDPTLIMLRVCLTEMGPSAGEAYPRERVANMLDFMENMCGLYDEFGQMSPSSLQGLAKLRGKLRGLLEKVSILGSKKK